VVVASASVLETTPDVVPTGAVAPVEGITDLRRLAPLGDRRLDHVYVDARSPAVVRWPDLALTMSFEAPSTRSSCTRLPRGSASSPRRPGPTPPLSFARASRGPALRRWRRASGSARA
jgi:hypothetical protein